MVSSTPRPHFTPGKDPVPILQEARWAPGPAWTGGKSRPHRDSIPDRPARSQSPYAIPTELPGPPYVCIYVYICVCVCVCVCIYICVYIYIYIFIYIYVCVYIYIYICSQQLRLTALEREKDQWIGKRAEGATVYPNMK